MVADLIKTLEEKRKELYGNFISQIIGIPSSNKSLVDHYEYVESEKVKSIREIIKKHPKPIELQKFENDCDKLAYEIIGFQQILSKEEFIKILPDLNAEVVFYLLKRMSEADRYNTHWNLKFQQLKPSIDKNINTSKLWAPYKERYNERIANGERPDVAINEIGKQMERDGVWKKASKKDPTKIITRPDRTTLWRHLVEKK